MGFSPGELSGIYQTCVELLEPLFLTLSGSTFWIFVVFIVLGNFTVMNLMIASILVQLGFVGDIEEEMKVELEILAWKASEERLMAKTKRTMAIEAGENLPLITLEERFHDYASYSGAACFNASVIVLRCLCYDGLRRTASRRPRPMDFRSQLRRFVTEDSSVFSYAIQVCIITNMVALAMDAHGIDQTTADVLELINVCLASVFAGEMAVKLVVIGVIDYARYSRHSFLHPRHKCTIPSRLSLIPNLRCLKSLDCVVACLSLIFPPPSSFD
jgi:hypothetical protein